MIICFRPYKSTGTLAIGHLHGLLRAIMDMSKAIVLKTSHAAIPESTSVKAPDIHKELLLRWNGQISMISTYDCPGQFQQETSNSSSLEGGSGRKFRLPLDLAIYIQPKCDPSRSFIRRRAYQGLYITRTFTAHDSPTRTS